MPKKTPRLFSLFLLFLIIFPALCQAQNKPLLALPDSMEMSGLAGETLSGKFAVFNQGELSVKMKVVTKNFRQKEQGGLEFFWSDEQSVCQWLKPSAQTLDFTLGIPAQTEPGGYLGAILFEAASDKDVGPKNSFGVLILANILTSAESAKEINPRIIELASNKINGSFPVGLALKVGNSTNYNASLNGELTIADWRGKIITKQKLNNLFVFPQSEKTFSWKWNGKSLFGIFKAQVALASAGGSQNDLASNIFLVIAWPVIIGLAALVAAVIAAMKYRQKIYSFETKTWFNFAKPKKRIKRAYKPKLKIVKDINSGST